MSDVADVEQEPVATTGAARESDCRIDGDIVTLGRAATGAGPGWPGRTAGRAGDLRRVDRVGVPRRDGEVLEDPGRTHDLGILGSGQRHLDHLDPEQRRVGILLRHQARATRQLIVGADPCGTRDVDKDVGLVLGIFHHRVGVGPAAGLDVGEVFRVGDVGGVEDPNPANPVVAHRFLNALGSAVEPAGQALTRDEQQVPVDRYVALRRRAEIRLLEGWPARVGDVPHIESVVVALEDVVAPECQVRITRRFESGRRWGVRHQPHVPGGHPRRGLPRAETDPGIGTRRPGRHIGGRGGRAARTGHRRRRAGGEGQRPDDDQRGQGIAVHRKSSVTGEWWPASFAFVRSRCSDRRGHRSRTETPLRPAPRRPRRTTGPPSRSRPRGGGSWR